MATAVVEAKKEFTPVRGDSIRYHGDDSWHTGVVLSVDESTVTVLAVDGTEFSRSLDTFKPVNDERMKLLATLPEEEATEGRESYLQDFITRTQERAAKEAAERAAKRTEAGKTDSVSTGKRGRPKTDRSVQIEAVFKLISESETTVTKTDILTTVEMNAGVYNEVLTTLKTSGRILQFGEKRGTRYGVPGKEYPEPTKAARTLPEADPEMVKKVVTFITKAKKPVSRAMVTDALKITDADWMLVRLAMMETGKVQVTGQKRGTRYSKA